MNYKYIFGPVPSRRLGLSLGVDLVPFKTCTLNCIYCESGSTTNLTTSRKEYVPLNELFSEMDDYFKNNKDIDYISFSGAGEPTLHSGIGKVISYLKENFSDYKIALFTNSTLLWDKGLQEELHQLDLVVPSLDAVSEEVFKRINKPESSLTSKKLIDGLIDFSKDFSGKLWLEIFIIPGINDSNEELKLFSEVIKDINPDKIQLNSIDRPPVESWVRKASYDELLGIQEKLSSFPVEIVAKYDKKSGVFLENEVKENILSIIMRRPCTIDDLENISGVPKNKLLETIYKLLEEGSIELQKEERGEFFRAV